MGFSAARRTAGILPQLQLAEAHPEGVDEEEAPHERLAPAQDELDRLGRLHDADEAGQDPEYAALRAGGHQARGRWLRVQAAVAGPLARREDAHLSLEPEDRPVDVGPPREDARVVHEVAGREVVGAIHHQVELAHDLERVVAGEPRLEGAEREVGVDRPQLLRRRVELLPAHVGRRVEDLPLQVRVVDDVEVHEPERSHPGRGEVERERGSESARADAEHLRRLEPLLPLHAHLRHDEVARVAQDLVVREGGGLRDLPPRDGGHDRERVALLRRGGLPLEVAHVLVVHVDVHERAQLPVVRVEVVPQVGVSRDEAGERLAHVPSGDVHRVLSVRVGPQGSGNEDLHGSLTSLAAVPSRWPGRASSGEVDALATRTSSSSKRFASSPFPSSTNELVASALPRSTLVIT